MADNHSKEVRSINMSHIRSTNSKPEEIVRKYLFAEGFRYRKNVKKLPGCPDIVLPKYKAVIFVNGCFWHKHDCPRFVWPSSNQDYWRPKILRNVERDNQSRKELVHKRPKRTAKPFSLSRKSQSPEFLSLGLYVQHQD